MCSKRACGYGLCYHRVCLESYDYVIPKGSVVHFSFIAIFRSGIEAIGLKWALDLITIKL